MACSRHLITVEWLLGIMCVDGMSVIRCARCQAPEFSEACGSLGWGGSAPEVAGELWPGSGSRGCWCH